MRSRLLSTSPVMLALALCLSLIAATPAAATGFPPPNPTQVFQRVAAFPVFLNTDIELETVAEIVAVSPNGRVLVYTDSQTESVGFVGLLDPANPIPLGSLPVGGEPTSVAMAGNTALVAVNTSESFANPSGKLLAIRINTLQIIAEYDLGGQPDSVAVSSDGRYAAVVVENERDEDLGDGAPPQLPGGTLVVIDRQQRTIRNVDLTGIADLYPADPEPEYVDINDDNLAVVTLQENNHIMLVDLPTAQVVGDFSAGTVDLDQIDTLENDIIQLDSSLQGVLREPDGVAWISTSTFATADEGDLDGGSRGFTIFDTAGNVVYSSGNTVEHIAARLGHYPEGRSENKGSEPEGVAFGRYASGDYLFVGLERASLALVYRLHQDGSPPEFVQALPSGVGPEGLLPIPERNLFVTAAETDEPGGIRSIITVYELAGGPPAYPAILSADDAGGLPITWGALSALAADPDDAGTVYTVRDSFYKQSSLYVVDVAQEPAVITEEIVLQDSNGALAAVAPSLVNGDGTVNLDLEGIAVRAAGGFWLASEGDGSVDDPQRPVTSPNLLVAASAAGVIEQVIQLPAPVDARQRRFGYEGVASVGSGADEVVFVAFQREWVGDPARHVRIGRYETATGQWAFYYYPLEMPVDAGWVGLSELTALDGEAFAVIERDNQADVYAAIKRIYQFSVAGLTPVADQGGTPAFPVVTKTLVHDLLPDLQATGGAVIEKVEGLAVLAGGTTLAVTDNDGVDGSNGETQLLRVPGLFAR